MKEKSKIIDAKIVDNNLTINTSTDGIYDMKFIKMSPVERNFILYIKNFQ